MPSQTPVHGTGTTGRLGLIDTSVAVGLSKAELARFSKSLAASTLTIAELTTGPTATNEELKRARRRDRLRLVETSIEGFPFDLACARAYGLVHAAVRERTGRKPRGSRAVDLMIAATALAHHLPLYTYNAKDLQGLEGLIEIVDLNFKGGT